MSYQLYTANYLLRKGISFCKQVCKERGIKPVGDLRQKFTWVDAIMQWQENYQPVKPILENATIAYDDSIEGSCEGEYCVLSDGEIIRRFRTYIKAESFCKGKYNLVSSLIIIKWFFSVSIPRNKKSFLLLIPNHKAPHSIKFVQTRMPPLDKGL